MKLPRLIRPPTRYTPSMSRKGSRQCNEHVFLMAVFFCLAADISSPSTLAWSDLRVLMSSWNAIAWTALNISFSADLISSTVRICVCCFPLDVWLFCQAVSSWSSPTAGVFAWSADKGLLLYELCASRRRNLNFQRGSMALAYVLHALSFSSPPDLLLVGWWDLGLLMVAATDLRASKGISAPRSTLNFLLALWQWYHARHRGLDFVSTCLHWLGVVWSLICWTRLATNTWNLFESFSV